MNRVVITGIGVTCSAGSTREQFLESLRTARCGISRIEQIDLCDLRFQLGGEVKNFIPTDHFPPKEADMMDRFAQFAVIAAREAVNQSGIEWTEDLRDTSAIVTGSCIGGQTTENQGFWDVFKLGKPRVHPMTIPK